MNGGDVGSGNAHTCFGLDAGSQFHNANRIQAVLEQRAVGIDAATQDQADPIGDQTPQPSRPLVRGQRVEFGAQCH